MGKAKLYQMIQSPYCRTVIAISRMLGIELEIHDVDLSKQEQLNEEYLKLNPFHVIPTLIDTDGFTLWESRVIAAYLIQSRKPDSELYPWNDLRKRTIIDRWLHYDLGTYSRYLTDIIYDYRLFNEIRPQRIERAKEALKTLDSALARNPPESYITGGDRLTLADVSLYFTTTLTTILPGLALTEEEYPHLKAWFERVHEAMKTYDQDGLFAGALDKMKEYAVAAQAKQP